MELFKSKKGDEFLAISTTVEFILLLIIVGLIVLVIARQQQNDSFEKKFLAKDLSMFIDSIYASPNNMVVKYPQEAKGYSYKLEDGKVTVYKKSQAIAFGQSNPFMVQSSILFVPNEITLTDDSEKVTTDEMLIIFTKNSKKIVPFAGILIKGDK